jgi:hypothetical protein
MSEEQETCCCCTEILTISNVVNSECGHQLCKGCFWKWTDENNSCPFCRKEFFNNSKHAEYVQLGKDMNTRIDNIDELRDQKEYIERRLLRLTSKCITRRKIHQTYKDEIKIFKVKKREIVNYLFENVAFCKQVIMWKISPKKAFKMWDKKQKQIKHEDRTRVVKMMRTVLEEMVAGHFDYKNRYIKESLYLDKLEMNRSSKRRRLSNGEFVVIGKYYIKSFVRSTNREMFIQRRCPTPNNYCLTKLFNPQYKNPVISGLDYASNTKKVPDSVDIWMSDHFKYQLIK